MVEGVDLFLLRLVEDRVGVGFRVDLAQRLQRLQVDDAHFVLATVAREAAATGRDRDAVHARRVGDPADDLVRRGVNHDDLGAVRDVETLRGGIDSEIIERTRTADVNLPDFLVRRIGRTRRPEDRDADECRDADDQHQVLVHER